LVSSSSSIRSPLRFRIRLALDPMSTICSASIALVLLWIRTMEGQMACDTIGHNGLPNCEDCSYLSDFYWSGANGPWDEHCCDEIYFSKSAWGTTIYLYQHPTVNAFVMSYQKGSASVWGWCNTGTSLLNCKGGKWWYRTSNGWYQDMDASWNNEYIFEDECYMRGRSEGQPIAEPPRGTRELPPDSSKWIFEIVVNRQFMVYIGVLASVFVIALLSIVTCYKRCTGPKVMVYDSN